jgi:WD40 repeat protein
MSVVFSPDGQTLIGGSADGAIEIWHWATAQQLTILTHDAVGSVMSLAISPDGELIVGGSADGAIHIWQRD